MRPQESALSHFLARRQAVRRYVKSLVGRDSDVDDVLQDVCMAILARGETAVEVQGISAWLRGIARNVVLHHWRSAHRHRSLLALPSDPDKASLVGTRSTEDIVFSRDALEKCWRELDERSRRVLTLRYIDGRTSREIARELQVSPAAVRIRLSRLRRKMRATLGASTK